MNAFSRLNPRERLLLAGALPIGLGLAAWQLGWVPLQEARAARQLDIAGYRLVAEAASRSKGAARRVAPEGPLAARVTASAEEAGLTLSRLDPEEGRLRVAVGEAAFAAVILWLADLEREGVRVTAVEMDRRTAPGMIDTRITVEDAT